MELLLNMPSRTFFTLLAEGNKLDAYDKRFLLTATSYPNMESDDQDRISQTLMLPDDILSDILEDEDADDVSKLKNTLEGNNGN